MVPAIILWVYYFHGKPQFLTERAAAESCPRPLCSSIVDLNVSEEDSVDKMRTKTGQNQDGVPIRKYVVLRVLCSDMTYNNHHIF